MPCTLELIRVTAIHNIHVTLALKGGDGDKSNEMTGLVGSASLIRLGGKQICSLTPGRQSNEECGIIYLTLREPVVQADKEQNN
jgi:hypothetical protein